MIAKRGYCRTGLILLYTLIGATVCANDPYAFLKSILEKESLQPNLENTTHSLFFASELVLPEIPDDKLKTTAANLADKNPALSSDQLYKELKRNQAERHTFKRVHYVNTPDVRLWEYSTETPVLDNLDSTSIGLTLADCRSTTDGAGFWSKINWPSKEIRIRDGQTQAPTDCTNFGRLSRGTVTMLSALHDQGPAISSVLALEEDATSRCLVYRQQFSLVLPGTETTVSDSIEFRVAFSNDDYGDLVHESRYANGVLVKESNYSEYRYNRNMGKRFPDRTLLHFGNGPIMVYRVTSPFSWEHDLSLWDLSVNSNLDTIQAFYVLLRHGFRLFSDPNVRVPAGLVHWVQ